MTLTEQVLYAMYTNTHPMTTSEVKDFVQGLNPQRNIERSTIHARVCELQDAGYVKKLDDKIKTHLRAEHLIALTKEGRYYTCLLFNSDEE